MGYPVDSNVLIDYAAERFISKQLLQLGAIFDQELNVSVITEIETLGFAATAEEDQKMQLLFRTAQIIELSKAVVYKTISLHRGIKIKTPDAIIAATVLVYDYALLSRNLSDFNKVPDLKVIDPHNW